MCFLIAVSFRLNTSYVFQVHAVEHISKIKPITLNVKGTFTTAEFGNISINSLINQ